MAAKLERIVKLSQELLNNDAKKSPREEVSLLHEIINTCDRYYYIENQPCISDYEYDMLFKKLQLLESENPELQRKDSPTQRVAYGLTDEFTSVLHNVAMLSLENSYNSEDLIDFDRKVRELSGDEKITYVVEPKFDGASIALVYEEDMLVRAATRGNGVEGDDITNNARVIRTIPLQAKFSTLGIKKIELRGEVVIEKNNFERMNKLREEQNILLRDQGKKELELYKNARNTASGGLRIKDSKEVAVRGLEAFIYQIGYAIDHNGRNMLGSELASHHENIELLARLGFKTPTIEKTITKGIDKVQDFCLEWEAKRDTYSYEIDGMVIKVDDLKIQESIGATAHHPRWAIAYKFKARVAQTKLIDVEYQVGRTGAITPVARLEPVPLSGVTISNVSLHNEDFILEKGIMIGDTVTVERAGDVIPYITGYMPEQRSGKETPIAFPQSCPSCNSLLIKPEEESIWRCINLECPAQAEERLIHFVSKDAMDIAGLGQSIIKRFMELGLIKGITDIYTLDPSQIIKLDGWKQKSIDNLIEGINRSKQQPSSRLLVGLGIRHVGTTMAKVLAAKVESLLDYDNYTLEQLTEIADVGPKVALSIKAFFNNEANLAMLRELEELGVNIKREERLISGDSLANKTFLFTGKLNRLTREQAEALVEEYGGKNLSSVSANLNYLVAGEKAGSKIDKAKKIATINVITEDDFIAMIGQDL